MTRHQFDEFLIAVSIICAFGAMLNISKVPSRGKRAYMLAGAFVTLAASVLLIRMNAAQVWVNLMGALTFGLLGADIVFRLTKMPPKPQRGSKK